jgi:hypothetical protein
MARSELRRRWLGDNLGKSGASSEGRGGFQRLIAEIGCDFNLLWHDGCD